MISPNKEINDKEGYFSPLSVEGFEEYWLQDLSETYYYLVFYDHLRAYLPGTGWVGAKDLDGTYYPGEWVSEATLSGPSINVDGIITTLNHVTGELSVNNPPEEIAIPIKRLPCGELEYDNVVGGKELSKDFLNEGEEIVDMISLGPNIVLTTERLITFDDYDQLTDSLNISGGYMLTYGEWDEIHDDNFGVITSGGWVYLALTYEGYEMEILSTDQTPAFEDIKSQMFNNTIIPNSVLTYLNIYTGAEEVCFSKDNEIMALYNDEFSVETYNYETEEWGSPTVYELEESGAHHIISINAINQEGR